MHRCTVSFAAGGYRHVLFGAVLPDDDPLVVKHPEMFEQISVDAKPAPVRVVEQATDAPDEVRRTTRTTTRRRTSGG